MAGFEDGVRGRSHDKDGQLVENGDLSATAAGKLRLPTPMNLEELLQP